MPVVSLACHRSTRYSPHTRVVQLQVQVQVQVEVQVEVQVLVLVLVQVWRVLAKKQAHLLCVRQVRRVGGVAMRGTRRHGS